MRVLVLSSAVCAIALTPTVAFADCDNGPPVNNICTVVGTTVTCDLTTNGYAGSGNSDLTAVYDPMNYACDEDVCIWGTDTSGATFCVEYVPGTTETVFEVRGGTAVDDIRFSWGTYNLDNFSGVSVMDARVIAGDGGDTVYGSRSTASDYHDELHGDDGADTVYGQAGHDEISGDAGTDTVDGGGGNDTISGGSSNDTIAGGDGNDTIDGDDGDDILDGDAGVDTIRGGIGTDSIDGGAGDDTIYGGGHDDLISGNTGNDTIRGESGNDIICGDGDTDTITGDAGDDELWYGSVLTGSETINGFDGTDSCQDYGTNPPTSNCEAALASKPVACP